MAVQVTSGSWRLMERPSRQPECTTRRQVPDDVGERDPAKVSFSGCNNRGINVVNVRKQEICLGPAVT